MDISKVGNKFKVAVLAAKRAKQIMKTGKKKIDIEASNPLTVALAEIESGLVTYETLKEEERAFIVQSEEAIASGEIVDTDETDNQVNIETISNKTKAEDEAATEEEILRKNLTTE